MDFKTDQGIVKISYLDVARWAGGATMIKSAEGQPGVLLDLDPAQYGVPRVFIPQEKIAKALGMADIARGNIRADAFLDEMQKIAATVEPHASIGNVVGEHEGAPGVSEALLGRQHSVERKAEEARQLGDPSSDKLQKVVARFQQKTAAVSSITYSKYFKNKMHNRGITSHTQLSEKGKKDFFNSVDSGWHSSQEKAKKLRSA